MCCLRVETGLIGNGDEMLLRDLPLIEEDKKPNFGII